VDKIKVMKLSKFTVKATTPINEDKFIKALVKRGVTIDPALL